MIFIALTLSVEAAPDVDALVQESRSGLTPEQTREYRAMAADIGEDRGSGSESHETADTAPVMDEAKKVASTSEDTDAAPADNHRVLTEAQRKEFEDLNKQDGIPGEKSSQAEPVKATPDQEEFKATQAEVGMRRESGSEPHEIADTAPVMDEAKKVTSTSEDTDAAPADNHHFLTDNQNKAFEDLNKQSESSEAVETTPEQDDTVTPVQAPEVHKELPLLSKDQEAAFARLEKDDPAMATVLVSEMQTFVSKSNVSPLTHEQSNVFRELKASMAKNP